VPLAFFTVNRFCMGLFVWRAGRLTAKTCGFRPGQRLLLAVGPDGGRWLPAAEATVLSLEPVSLSLRTALEVALAAAVLYLILGDFHRFQARPGPASRRRCPELCTHVANSISDG
jgi:hypothetical protein